MSDELDPASLEKFPSAPGVQRLSKLLSEAYAERSEARALVERISGPLARDVSWDEPVSRLWGQILWKAAKRRMWRALLATVEEDESVAAYRKQIRAAADSIEQELRDETKSSRSAPRRRGPEALTARAYLDLHTQASASIEAMSRLARQLDWRALAIRVAELKAALCQDPYRVVIAGKSRAGKSTLMNALVGRALCPVQDFKTTAVPIVIGPGAPEQFRVHLGNGSVREGDGPVTADQLAPYADQRHNPRNRKGVTHIEVALENEILALGVQYLDVPGFDDPVEAIAAETQAALDAAHAWILVVDVAPFRWRSFVLEHATMARLKQMGARDGRIFVVCNKIDALEPADRELVRQHVREQLAEFEILPKLAHSELFFMSAKRAVEARSEGQETPEYVVFYDALWSALWETPEVGMQRLRLVFEGLRVTSDEAAALITIRDDQQPNRDRIRVALKRCVEERNAIEGAMGRAVALAQETLEGCLGELEREQTACIAAFVAGLGDRGLPRRSQAIAALRPEVETIYAACLSDLGKTLRRSVAQVTPRIERALGALRESVELPESLRAARGSLLREADWATLVGYPDLGDRLSWWRSLGAGGVTGVAGALLALVFGGPIGVIAASGGVLGAIGAIVANLVTNDVLSPQDLRRGLDDHFGKRLDALERQLRALFERRLSEVLIRRVRARMTPFLEDVADQLEAMRPLTDEERALHAKLSQEIERANELLEQTFPPGGST